MHGATIKIKKYSVTQLYLRYDPFQVALTPSHTHHANKHNLADVMVTKTTQEITHELNRKSTHNPNAGAVTRSLVGRNRLLKPGQDDNLKMSPLRQHTPESASGLGRKFQRKESRRGRGKTNGTSENPFDDVSPITATEHGTRSLSLKF